MTFPELPPPGSDAWTGDTHEWTYLHYAWSGVRVSTRFPEALARRCRAGEPVLLVGRSDGTGLPAAKEAASSLSAGSHELKAYGFDALSVTPDQLPLAYLFKRRATEDPTRSDSGRTMVNRQLSIERLDVGVSFMLVSGSARTRDSDRALAQAGQIARAVLRLGPCLVHTHSWASICRAVDGFDAIAEALRIVHRTRGHSVFLSDATHEPFEAS